MPSHDSLISSEFHQHLVAERDRLRAERAEIERAIQRQAAVAQALERIEGLLALEEDGGATEENAPGNMGPREAIRFVLRNKPDGLSSTAVMDEVERLGLCREVDSKIPVRHRIAGELSRMVKRGKLLRRYKRYRLPE